MNRDKRLRLYPLALLSGGAIGFLFYVLSADGLVTPSGARIGGDFPAFYGAGLMVRNGQSSMLYDGAAQEHVQAAYMPDAPGNWIHFAYPPFVALAYAPLTLFPFKLAYVLHAALMSCCAVWALHSLRQLAPAVDRYFWLAVVATLTSYPMLIATTGGQNAAFSLLCAAGAAASLGRQLDVRAGIWLGAWCFKPQFALTAMAIIAFRRPRVLVGVTSAAFLLYLAGAAVAGWSWPAWWWSLAVQPFATADLDVDRGNGVSFREWASEAGVPLLGWVASAAVVGWALRSGRSQSPWRVSAFAVVTALLVAPHALYYDVGIATIAVVALIDAEALSGRSVAVLWAATFLQFLRPLLPVPPLTIILMFVAYLTAVKATLEPIK